MSTQEQGLSLDDIGNITGRVEIGDGFAVVHGLSFGDILTVFDRFPDTRRLLVGGSMIEMLKVAPQAAAAVIAGGFQKLGDKDAEDTASRIALETQLDLLEEIGRRTFRNGFGPFVKRLTALGEGVVKSVNFGKVPDTSLPLQSKPLSPPASPSPMPGN